MVVFFERSNIRHRVFRQGDAGNARWVRERFRQNHDHGIVREIIAAGLVGFFGYLVISLSDFLHGRLTVVAWLRHGFWIRQAQEIDCGAIQTGIAGSVP